MNIRQSHTSLTDVIRKNSFKSREIYQVTQRMTKLLPENLKAIKARHRSNSSAARAERLAMTDDEYQELIDEYTELLAEGLEARIQYETHKMLLAARQSLRFFRT